VRPCPRSLSIPPSLLEVHEEAECGEEMGRGESDRNDLSWLLPLGNVRVWIVSFLNYTQTVTDIGIDTDPDTNALFRHMHNLARNCTNTHMHINTETYDTTCMCPPHPPPVERGGKKKSIRRYLTYWLHTLTPRSRGTSFASSPCRHVRLNAGRRGKYAHT